LFKKIQFLGYFLGGVGGTGTTGFKNLILALFKIFKAKKVHINQKWALKDYRYPKIFSKKANTRYF